VLHEGPVLQNTEQNKIGEGMALTGDSMVGCKDKQLPCSRITAYMSIDKSQRFVQAKSLHLHLILFPCVLLPLQFIT
jgi:hypothetical protein